MKEGIHPKYHDVDARCACGATWKTRSTKPELHLEICSNCHPFFTGKQKLLDTEGRIVRFTKKFGVADVGKPQAGRESQEGRTGRRSIGAAAASSVLTRHQPSQSSSRLAFLYLPGSSNGARPLVERLC